MTRSAIRTLLFAGVATILTAIPAGASVTVSGTDATPAKATAVRLAAIQCMTDDGYGRKRPCDAQFKKQNPNWRATDNCMTDDGHGRTRPCSAQYKEKHKK